MGFTIQFEAAKDWTPYEGGGDLFPFEGLTYGIIKKIEAGISETSKNHTLSFTLECEETEGKGLRVKKSQAVSGKRKDDKPNVVGLYEAIAAIHSVSMPAAEAQAKVQSLEGRGIDSDALIKELTGKRVAFEVAARSYAKGDGSTGWGSEVKNFVMWQRYSDAQATNTHHRKLPDAAANREQVGQPQSAAPAGQTMFGGNAPAAAPNGASTNQAQPAAPQGAPQGALGIL